MASGENGIANPSSNLDRAVCISFHTNTTWKGMNQSIFLQAMGNIAG